MLGAAPRTRCCVVLVVSAAVAVAAPSAGYAGPHQAKLSRRPLGSGVSRVVTPRTGGARVVGVVGLAPWRSVAAIGVSRADTQRPTRPTGLAVASAGQTVVVLSWVASTDNVGVAGYGVYENGSLVASQATTGYTLVGLSCGTSYAVAVDAYDAAGNRSEKATITASTAACADVSAPSVPSGLSLSGVGQSAVTLSWVASSDNVGVAGYKLYAGGLLVGTATATAYTFSGLACGTGYTFGVAAYDAAGNVSGMATASAVTSGCSSPPPGGGTANVWVASGGSAACVRSAAPVDYATAAAGGSVCDTFNRAYHAAAASGDLVLVKCGSYGGQAFTVDSPKSGMTTFQSESPDCAVVQAAANAVTMSIGSASWITLRGFALNSSTGGSVGFPAVTDSSNLSVLSTHVAIDGNDIDVGKALGGCCGLLIHAAQNWTITNNTFGPSCCGFAGTSSPEAIRIGKPNTVAPGCTSEACNITISNNLFQYNLDNAGYWPSSGWGTSPEPTCTNSTLCHLDAIHVWGCITCSIVNNRFYGEQCQDLFFESTNNSLNKDISIIGNSATSIANQCNGFIDVKADGTSGNTAGHWKIGFNESPSLITLGFGWSGAAPGTVFDIYGNYTNLFMVNASGNNAGCNGGTPANVTINYSYNVWRNSPNSTKGPCSPTDTVGTTPAWLNPSPAPAVGLDMHKTGPTGIADNFVPCATVLDGCPATDIDGNPRPQTGNADAGADER